MNITRNNYEEFFLLYADGELNAADKMAVENFVKLHPDLEEELEMLMDTILVDNSITMPNKSALLKGSLHQEELATPQQEALLLLLDNELPAAELNQLKKTIATDKALQNEWNLLQQTKLPVIAVEMPDKEELYRREKDRRPIPILVVRWMAAAAVIAGLGWYGLNLYNNKGNNLQVATNNGNQPAKVNTVTPDKVAERKEPNDVTTGIAGVEPKVDYAPKDGSMPVPRKTNVNSNNKSRDQQPQPNQQPSEVQYAKNEQQPPVEMAKDVAGNPNVAVIEPIESVKPIIKTTQQAEPDQTIAKTAVYNEDSINDAEYVNIAGAHIKKQKLRGMFRNVTRTIGRSFDKSNVAQVDNDAPLNR